MRSRVHMAAMLAVLGALPTEALREMAPPRRRDPEPRPRLPPIRRPEPAVEAGPLNARQIAAEAKRARKNARRAPTQEAPQK